MRTIDFAPLYRSTVGFDRLFSMLDNVGQPDQGTSYPPYNIERTGEDAYRISMAVAGFGEDELVIETKENTLTVTGEKNTEENNSPDNFLFRGIAGRSFERRFQLADFVKVSDASLKNGLLHIELLREIPEAMKPRQIAIKSAEKETQKLAKKKGDKVKQIAA
ncbi:MAG: Hsp20 family protein [Nitratireductor sp.]